MSQLTAYMTNERLGSLINKIAEEIHEEQLGFWRFNYQEKTVYVITDEVHNRMRIISPVIQAESLQKDELSLLLSANYDRALDARYCINDGILWSAFIHPLIELGEAQFLDAVKQVVGLCINYGSSYSSGVLVFGNSS